jgi:hypothetical protein
MILCLSAIQFLLFDKGTQNTSTVLQYRFWQPGCRDHTYMVLDPWLCVPVFQRVCLYRTNDKVLKSLMISPGFFNSGIDKQNYSEGSQSLGFHFGNIGLQVCNAGIVFLASSFNLYSLQSLG